ncbi:N-carbamoyl-L-amino acid hydrolase [Raoultella terrigena]|uniref:N-carbamoyl-L-amino acid hydrolase n=1 Tax=Raoultella terrigena TaxID=577 RepID=A0A3P8J487_RAOTE|nr:N-carbamoyl-L-amino acid hydrolase [Raoultella terrigena]
MITVNGERLWATLNEMATIGATPAGGVTRLTLSEEDRRPGICCATGRWRRGLATVSTAWAICLSAGRGKIRRWRRC